MWEQLNDQSRTSSGTEIRSSRLKVPKGWIVRSVVASANGGVEAVQTFVEDDGHDWKL